MPGKKLLRHFFMLQDGVAGIALILVTMIVALATIVVINGTYSTFLSGRSVGMVERQLQAEFILKSIVHIAAELLAADQSPNVDSKEDIWGAFLMGAPVPDEILQELGLNDPGMRVYLEIAPENSKLRIDLLSDRQGSKTRQQSDADWKERYVRLFESLGFDTDLAEPDHTGHFPNQVVTSEELAEHMHTYQRKDINDSRIPTGNGQIERIGELISVPGFTPARLNAISPYITTKDDLKVNVNVALPKVLEALHPDMPVQQIIDYRESVGTINDMSELEGIMPGIYPQASGLLTLRSKYFQVIGKVEYGGGISYFARAYVLKSGGRRGKASISSILLY